MSDPIRDSQAQIDASEEWRHFAAVSAITKFCDRRKVHSSGLAIMFHALGCAEENGFTDSAIRDEFTEPFATQLIKAIGKKG